MKKRSIPAVVLLSLLTCGIYSIYWLIATTNEIESEIYTKGESCKSGGTVFLLSIVTCGIYLIYWYYKQGERIAALQKQVGISADSKGMLYLILSIFGLGIVSDILIQDDLNKYLTQKNA
jgi:hypothetical protein